MKSYKLLKHVGILLAAGVSTIGLAGCNSSGGGNAATSDAAKDASQMGQGLYITQPGAAYDTSTSTVVSDQSCLIAARMPNNVTVTTPETRYSLANINLNRLEGILNTNVSGLMGGAVFASSDKAQFLQQITDTPYKLNLNYSYEFAGMATLKTQSGTRALVPYAKKLAEGGPKDQLQFRKMCGNSFLPITDAGALVVLSVSLSFNSSADKQAFQTALSTETSIGNIAKSIQHAADEANVTVYMSLNPIQFGGEPNQLVNVINGNLSCGDINHNPQGVEQCAQTIDGVIQYVQTVPSQVTNPDGSINLQNAYYMNSVTEKYTALGINVNAPDPSPQVLAAAQQLVKLYHNADFNYQFAAHYLTMLKKYLTTASQVSLQDTHRRYRAQIDDVFMNQSNSIFATCFQGYLSERCLNVASNVESILAQSQYAIPSDFAALLNYFESSIYTTKLYSYIGGGSDQPDDYQKRNCMLYPVSTLESKQYVIYCGESTFFPSAALNGLQISQSTESAGMASLTINGLQYTAINPKLPQYSEAITYPSGLILQQVSGYPGTFSVNAIHVTGGKSFSTDTADLMLIQAPKWDI